MKLQNGRSTGLFDGRLLGERGGLRSAVVGVRAFAFFCCLWIAEITDEGKEETSRAIFMIELLNFSFSD